MAKRTIKIRPLPIGTYPKTYLFPFMEKVIDSLIMLEKVRTSETYQAALNSFKKFRNGKDILITQMDTDLMLAYEAFLRENGISSNTSSFYMRNLRAVYNRAVDKGVTPQLFPFKRVYTGIGKTAKRAIPASTIRKIKEMDLSARPSLDFARNLFLFSFYTRGMSFIDMAFLKKADLCAGVLTYRRRKTGQQIFVKWERCMQEILNKYDTAHSAYLLPIIHPSVTNEERRQYIYTSHNINRSLKIIGNLLGLEMPLTMYVARHAWASIARSNNIPLSVISEGMGHDSEKTTRIYLSTLDTSAIDKANRLILKGL